MVSPLSTNACEVGEVRSSELMKATWQNGLTVLSNAATRD
jgi:hypothetical protein